MRAISIVVVCVLALGVFNPSNSKASTLNFDISNGGFSQNGIPEIEGIGYTFLSPLYTVGYGANVNFGVAELSASDYDLRGGCNFTNTCAVYYSYSIAFYNNGIGSLSSAPFTLEGAVPITGWDFNYCPDLVCPVISIPLLFTLPAQDNSVQFGFEGTGVSVDPPQVGAVPEPSTWAMLLIGFAGIGFARYRRRQKLYLPAL